MIDDKSRIVHVVYRLAVGGLENGLVNLVNRLPAGVWRHTIVSLTDVDPVFARRIERSDVDVVALGKRPGHAIPLYPRLWRLFRRLRPAIVHTRNLAALEVVPAAWLAGVPIRVHGEHGRDAADPAGTNPHRRRIRRMFRPFVSHYVALSPDLAAYLVDAIRVRPARVEQIFNGVDTVRFAPAPIRASIVGCPFLAPGLRLIGSVGRLDPVKGHADLARAFAQLLQRRPELRDSIRLVIVGEGSERERVQEILHSHGAGSLAWLPGERADIAELLRGLDVFVLPSHGEGVSNTILEAMACGLPVVATRVGANADLVEHGCCGTIVPTGDADALAGAIERYIDDDALARSHGREARQRVEQRFSLDRMVDRYHQLYLSLVAQRAGAVATRDATGGHRVSSH